VRAAVAGDTCRAVKPGARSETVIVAADVIVAAANPVPVPAAVTVIVVAIVIAEILVVTTASHTVVAEQSLLMANS
jgi:hypothetical protein